MFVRVTSGYLFARLTSAPPGLRLELSFSIEVLCIGFILCITGCSASVEDLITDGKYEEALVLIEDNPDKYADVYDEVRYKVAQVAFDEGDFARAASLLQDNDFENASSLIDDVKYRLAEIAIEDEEYEEAVALLTGNNNENAATLLAHVYEIKTACEIEAYFNEMLNEIEEHNPDKWNPNFDYLDGIDFYLRISDMLNETYDIIIRDNKLDNATEIFMDVFGYEPTSVTQAKDAIEQLSNDMAFEKFYDSPYSYLQCLYYVMDTLTKHSDFVRFEMTNTSGFMVIEQPYKFLQEKGISARTLAYLLGTCKDMGAEIDRDSERIVVTYENVQSDTYYSRGYYYCLPNAKHDDLSKFYSNLSFSINRWGIDEIGVWMDVTITNPGKYNLKYLSLDAVLINVNGTHLETASVLLRDISDEEVTFTLDFYDVTMDELIEKNCNVEFFPAIVIN